jgi:hypothetical protein
VTASPAVEFVLFVIGAAATYILLGLGLGESYLLDARAWDVWRATAAVAVGLSSVFLYRGVKALWALPDPVAGLSDRWKWFYFLYACLLGVGVFLFLLRGLGDEVPWPIDDMDRRTNAVAIAGGLAAVPWVALILIAQRPLRRPRSGRRPEFVRRLRGWLDQGGRGELTLHGRLQIWDLITACLTAFALFVALALIPTGALRALWLVHVDAEADAAGDAAKATAEGESGTTSEEVEAARAAAVADRTELLDAEFSALDVLLYGAFFAVVLAAFTVPVLAVWRDTSRRLIDASIPLPNAADVNGDVVEKRQRLEALLHLDKSLLRNPLTVFSVFTPLITSLLAAFVPELKP